VRTKLTMLQSVTGHNKGNKKLLYTDTGLVKHVS